MARSTSSWGPVLLVVLAFVAFLPAPAAAFGAGNIPSIAQVEGVNWRHGGELLLGGHLPLSLIFFLALLLTC